MSVLVRSAKYGGYYRITTQTQQSISTIKRIIIESKRIRLIVIEDGHNKNQVLTDTIQIIHQDKDMSWALEQLFKMLNLPCPNIDIKRDRATIETQYK